MSLALADDDMLHDDITHDDMTHTSVEYPRRATLDRDRNRLSMVSAGGPRLSENFGDATGLESDSDVGGNTGVMPDGEQDETIISHGAFDRG
jgi:hypothetical protein